MSRKICILMLSMALMLSGCGQSKEKQNKETSSVEIFTQAASVQESQTASVHETSVPKTTHGAIETESSQNAANKMTSPYGAEEDYVTDIPADAVYITGSGDQVEISGQGAQAQAGAVTITKAGTYVLKGNFNGQVRVDAGKEELVRLVLAGADIVCEESAAIYNAQKGKTILTLQSGTTNQVTDGYVYAYGREEEEEPDAVIFCKGDLSINGTGTLIVRGNYENGIKSKGSLLIVSGICEITAAEEAVQGKGTVTIIDGTIDIKGCEEGIEGRQVIVNGGNIYVEGAENDAIDSDISATVTGGTIVATGNGAMAINFGSDSTQCYLLCDLQSRQKGGTQVVLKDQAGKELLSRTIGKGYDSVLISLPEMQADGTYVLTAGTETVEITLNQLSYGTGRSPAQ